MATNLLIIEEMKPKNQGIRPCWSSTRQHGQPKKTGTRFAMARPLDAGRDVPTVAWWCPSFPANQPGWRWPRWDPCRVGPGGSAGRPSPGPGGLPGGPGGIPGGPGGLPGGPGGVPGGPGGIVAGWSRWVCRAALLVWGGPWNGWSPTASTELPSAPRRSGTAAPRRWILGLALASAKRWLWSPSTHPAEQENVRVVVARPSGLDVYEVTDLAAANGVKLKASIRHRAEGTDRRTLPRGRRTASFLGVPRRVGH